MKILGIDIGDGTEGYMSLDEAVRRFRARSMQYVRVSDVKGLRKLYVETTASAAMRSDETARRRMLAELHDVLMYYQKRVPRGMFDDM